jgi:hypothetical protein
MGVMPMIALVTVAPLVFSHRPGCSRPLAARAVALAVSASGSCSPRTELWAVGDDAGLLGNHHLELRGVGRAFVDPQAGLVREGACRAAFGIAALRIRRQDGPTDAARH